MALIQEPSDRSPYYFRASGTKFLLFHKETLMMVPDPKKSINVAVVCGDGLPASGLLTTLRNTIDLVREKPGSSQLLNLPVSADFGYSWRPDKRAFFPRGPQSPQYPCWLKVRTDVPVECDGLDVQLKTIRSKVARHCLLSTPDKEELRRSIDYISKRYQGYFKNWFEEEKVDWVFTINMTLSDAVPVTLALHNAASERWGNTTLRPGGILFLDHDLFGSYAVHEDDERVYPREPNELTPIPSSSPYSIWSLVSEALLLEAKSYPTTLQPILVPNILPALRESISMIESGQNNMPYKWLLQNGLLEDVLRKQKRLLLCPARIFPVKGIETSILLLAAIQAALLRHGHGLSTKPCLLVFGNLAEDPAYAQRLLDTAKAAGVSEDIHFLNGVPLCTDMRADGSIALDEKDQLSLCAATHGGVLYTPSTLDVESIGLGPALAAIARVPCAVSRFNALTDIYGSQLHAVVLEQIDKHSIEQAASSFVHLLLASSSNAAKTTAGMGYAEHLKDNFDKKAWAQMAEENLDLMTSLFPTTPWKRLWIEIATRTHIDPQTLEEASIALQIESSEGKGM